MPNLDPIGLFSCPWDAENCQFCRILNVHMLWWRYLAGNGESRTRVHNYKPSPIQRHQNRFLYSNDIWTKSLAQTMSFNNVTDRQTDRQTKELNVFASPGGARSPSPTKLGMVIEDLEHVLAPPKRFVIRDVALCPVCLLHILEPNISSGLVVVWR